MASGLAATDSMSQKLRCVSYLAPNMFWFYKTVALYLGRVLDVETQITQSQFEPLSDPVMRQDRLDIAFICGLPFGQYSRAVPNQIQALVAPVMQKSRYQNSPVYFSDVIVRTDSAIAVFDNLAGKILCYNDPGSNSGYNLLRQRLNPVELSSFFGKVFQSGSHQRSIKMVIDGLADCAAIDSTVLEQELRDSPELSNYLRVVESIGPCPIPPMVAAQRLGSTIIDLLQSALCNPDAELRKSMEQAQIQHYVAVEFEDYATKL